MAQYANQRTFVIKRDIPKFKKGEQFVSVYTENVAAAARNLNGEVAFKLYIYLLSNKDDYKLDYSPQHFANLYGVSLDSAKRSVKKLEEARYLIKSKDCPGVYTFYEVPQEEKKNIKVSLPKIEKRKIPMDGGTFVEMTFDEVYKELKEDYSEDSIKEFWNECEVA